MSGANQVVLARMSKVAVAVLTGIVGMDSTIAESLENKRSGRGIYTGFVVALLKMMIASFRIEILRTGKWPINRCIQIAWRMKR